MTNKVKVIEFGMFGNKMRGHHLPVLDGYHSGRFTDDDFRKLVKIGEYGDHHYDDNIKPKMDYLLENQDTEIELTNIYGMFCDGCGKYKNGDCKKQKGIGLFDRKLIEKIGKDVGDTITIRELMPLIENISPEYEQHMMDLLKENYPND
jgi:hypothetical protein